MGTREDSKHRGGARGLWAFVLGLWLGFGGPVRGQEVGGGESVVPGVDAGGGGKTPGIRKPPPKSESSSGQFLVFGESQQLRAAFCVAAEDVKEDLLQLLGKEDEWEANILIVVKDEPIPGRAVVPRVFALDGGGAHFQMDVILNDRFGMGEFSQQLLKLLLAETVLRGESAKVGKVVTLPDWVAVGIAESVDFRRRARPSARFSAVFRAGKNLGVDEILEAEPGRMDSVTREIYEASCCALMETLLAQPNGLVRMRRFLGALEGYRGSVRELLYQHFPALGLSENSLGKWWALQVATLAEGGSFETLGARETEMRLQEALTFIFPADEVKKKRSFLGRIFGKKEEIPVRPEVVADPGEELEGVKVPVVTLTLANYEEIMERDDREAPLRDSARRLARLQVRAYPLYKPLIADYDKVLGAMIEGEKKNVSEAIAALAQSRTETLARARQTESYLDWFEGTQVRSKSGDFENYHRAVEEMEAMEKRRRPDAISRYLDALEREF